MNGSDKFGRWHVYVLECADDTLYTGITTDLERRVREHNESPQGARYTRSRRPVELVAAWNCPDQSTAARDEAAFKSLSRDEKLRRVAVGATPSVLDSLAEAYAEALPAGEPRPRDFRSLRLVENDRLEAALDVRDASSDVREALARRMPDLEQPTSDPVFFDGPELYDGHVLVVDDSPVVFFDAALLSGHAEHGGYAPRVHAAHEWAHALHYANTPAFAPERSNGDASGHSRDLGPLLRLLVVEGLSSYASLALTGCDRRLATWFGLVDDDTFGEWRDRAASRRPDLATFTDTSDRMDERRRHYFGLDGAPVDSRHGYLYGLEIAERAARDADGMQELFRATPDDWRSYCREYFGAD